MMERMTNTWLSKVPRGQPMRVRTWGGERQDGAALVETAVAMGIYLSVLFGLVAFCYALYTYNFVSDAARLATRYAVVRGLNSCKIAPTFPDCNMPDITPASALQTYVQNLGYPGINSTNVTVTATWLSATTVLASGGNTVVTGWATCAPTSTDPWCNANGDAVQVQVTYTFPLNIPFWKNGTLTVGSNSQMVINE